MSALPEMPESTSPSPFQRYLESDNEVLRCAAIRAVAAGAEPDETAREALLAALTDEDPDVRADAMEGLVSLALAEDAPAIRESLQGDPVREVKLAAIAILARLNDRESIDLLRALVRDRAEGAVAWEDDASDWEDWLDIQVAAIAALADMGVTEAIEDFFAAKDDEFGQTLDTQVFGALARLGAEGMNWLLASLEVETGLPRKRAVDALVSADRTTMIDHVDQLLGAAEPAIRAAGVTLLDVDHERLDTLLRQDPDASVRRAVLCHAADARPGLALVALEDQNEDVQAEALARLPLPLPEDRHETIVDNTLAWLGTATAPLAVAAATRLPDLAPNRAEAPLHALAEDISRPLEARIAATEALARLRPAVDAARFAALLCNPARQVRVAALTHLRDMAGAGDATAAGILVRAIDGTLPLPAPQSEPRSDDDAPDLAAPKGEGAGQAHIRITPDGEIVEADTSEAERESGTLGAILAAGTPVETRKDTDGKGKRRKRRAVEGDAASTEALSVDAIRLCPTLDVPGIAAALFARCHVPEPEVRRAAWIALAERGEGFVDEAQRESARRALRDEDPQVRLAAYRLLATDGLHPELLSGALQDPDTLVRTWAVSQLPAETAAENVADEALSVRQAAVSRVVARGSEPLIGAIVDRLVAAERSDTLAQVLAEAACAAARVRDTLSGEALSPRKALVILDAFAETGSH